MSGEFPQLMWQREYNKKWTPYSYEEICLINKAVKKKQKTVSLPSNDPKKKIIINLELMIQKNLVSGFEQRVRCLIFNDSHICWSWKGDYEEWISYEPRVTYLLEVAYEKNMEKIDISLKDYYEVNLQQLMQVNKETGFQRSVSRDIIKVKYPKDNPDSQVMMMKDNIASRELVIKRASEDFNRFQTYLFNIPASNEESSNSLNGLTIVPDEIITALSAEVQASTSAQNDIFVAVDPECPEASNYVVYCENDDVYNATLNFSNLRDNNNKFFIIQLLRHQKKKKFAVWFHWGRVGYKGQCNLINCGSNLEEAKSTFEKKFYDKTRNHWSERNDFKRVPTKYDLVHVELASEVSGQLSSVETKLDSRIQDLLQIICNKDNLEDAAKEMCYDSSNTPLGKITARQILEGYDALNEITTLIKTRGKCRELIEANNNFYTKIPHDFGRKTPPLLCQMSQVKEKLKMLEDLSNICLAMDLLCMTSDGSENIIDKYYRSLECNLIPLGPTSDEFQALCKCLVETHGSTHSTYTMELIDAFKCVKEEQETSFLDVGNKKLLWHGSRISNWIGILKKGLQIAPPEAPSTGYMFGKGIYFADTSSKSANYCFATRKKNEGLLLLSEVSLGNALSATDAEDYSNLPDGYHSVYGIGKIHPRTFETTVLSSEATVPCGPLEEKANEDLSLIYNEYIVYNVHQVKMKYLLRIRFNF